MLLQLLRFEKRRADILVATAKDKVNKKEA